MAAIYKVIRLSQKIRGPEHSFSTLCLGFVGRGFQKKYCRIHHAIESTILEAILKKKMAAISKVVRLSQKLRDTEPLISTLCLGSLGCRLEEKVLCRMSVLEINHFDVYGGHFYKMAAISMSNVFIAATNAKRDATTILIYSCIF